MVETGPEAGSNARVAALMAEGRRGGDDGIGPRTAAVAAWSLVHGRLLEADHRIDAGYTEAGIREVLIDQVMSVFGDAFRAGA